MSVILYVSLVLYCSIGPRGANKVLGEMVDDKKKTASRFCAWTSGKINS